MRPFRSRSTTPVEMGPDERLIAEQDARVERHRARKRHSTRHSTRKLGWHEPCRTAQSHGMQLHQHDGSQQRLRQIRMLTQWKCDVLERVEIGKERPLLEEYAHVEPYSIEIAGSKFRDIFTLHQNLAPIRPHLTGDESQECRLARAARAHDGGDTTASHLQVETSEDAPPAHDTFHILEDDTRGFGGLSVFCCEHDLPIAQRRHLHRADLRTWQESSALQAFEGGLHPQLQSTSRGRGRQCDRAVARGEVFVR